MILVTEDHAETRHALVRLLTYNGLEPVGVEDGRQAMMLLREHTPRLGLLDYAMPGMNGFDVLRAMRSEPRLRDVPVLIFSAYDSDALRGEALRLGARGYVVKGAIGWDALLWEIRHHAGADAAARTDQKV